MESTYSQKCQRCLKESAILQNGLCPRCCAKDIIHDICAKCDFDGVKDDLQKAQDETCQSCQAEAIVANRRLVDRLNALIEAGDDVVQRQESGR